MRRCLLVLVTLALLTLAAVPGALAAETFRTAVLATNPYAYWGLGETTGPAVDLAGARNATFFGGTPESSLLRGAPEPLRWAGAGIRLDDQSNLDGGGGLGGYVATGMRGEGIWDGRHSFSVNVWVKWDGYRIWRTGTARTAIVGAYQAFPYDLGWGIDLPSNSSTTQRLHFFRSSTSPGITAPGPLPIGAWTMVTGTYDGLTLRLYVNGELVGAREDPSSAAAFAPFSIGRLNYNNALSGHYAYFKGSIDEVGLWNRTLTSLEIERIYNADAVPPQATLVFVPGIAGSVLERGSEELWPRAGSLYWKNDKWLLGLRLEANGSDEWNGAAVPRAADIVRTFDPYGRGPLLGPKDIYRGARTALRAGLRRG